MLESGKRDALDMRLADAALAYRLLREMTSRLDKTHERGRAELALLQIEGIGNFLEIVGEENGCYRGVSQWKARKAFGAESVPESNPATR
jgi:hypothetical protein